MRKNIFLFLMIVLVSLLASCTTTPSDTITTQGFYPTYRVTSDGSITTLFASFQVSGSSSNTYIYLDSGDSIDATVGTSTVTFTQETGLFANKYYSGTVPGGQDGQVVTFRLHRSTEPSALHSTVVIPNGFSISSPATTAVLSRANDAVNIAWAPAGFSDTMELTLTCPQDAQCNSVGPVVGDPGVFTIRAGELVSSTTSTTISGRATIIMDRKRAGTLDPAFTRGGVIEALQERTSTFYSNP
jgi:hypothetical protein